MPLSYSNPNRWELDLPKWLTDLLDSTRGTTFDSVERRMELVVDLAAANVERRTGGPFAAAIFDQGAGTIVAAGVNLVEHSRTSIAHAEMVAILFAQRAAGSYDLGAAGMPRHELVTSTEPCAMCLGALVWSGVRSVVCGACEEDASRIGFDEGPKPGNWVGALEDRGISVKREVLRHQATQVLAAYADQGGLIYNSRQASDPS